ncbi:class I SAM-dependent methyltransferase [Candidatus Parcubacteria bacterium]|nr:class I SAM-dependent methyltransferase [Candidatus Parcubacteria bacterium]
MNRQYSAEWFNKQKIGASSSAEVVLPIVIDLVNPKSVVDVGCGVGMWLEFFLKNGISDVLGIDGEWVDESELHIPKDRFRKVDIAKPFDVGRSADLAVCLEVGEHLPHEAAEGLVKSLTNIAPVVLFSAAIPHQPGTNHINSQWPEYWAELFKERGFIPVDAIRRKVWTNPNVEYWYAQNTILYIKKDAVKNYPKIAHEIECGYSSALPLVHPRRYFYALQPPPGLLFRIRRKIRYLLDKMGVLI